MLLALSSCTRNHGDIGPWFGTWHVEQITVDGEPLEVKGDFFFQFQSKVFRFSQVGGHEQTVESYGTWEEGDGTLTVTFPDHRVVYITMPGLEIDNKFTITAMSSHEVTLSKHASQGLAVTYRLRKNT